MTEETAGTPRRLESVSFMRDGDVRFNWSDNSWSEHRFGEAIELLVKDRRKLEIEVAALTTQRDEKDELHRMQLVAIGVVSLANSRNSAARLDRSNPYWTDAYQDVATAIDREIAARERAEAAEAERDAAKRALAEMKSFVAHNGTLWEAESRVNLNYPEGSKMKGERFKRLADRCYEVAALAAKSAEHGGL